MKKSFGIEKVGKIQHIPGRMIDKNHLGKSFYEKSDIFEDIMGQIFSTKNFYADNPLMSTLTSMGSTRTLESDTHEWKLMGASIRPLVVIENMDSTNTMKGAGQSEFKLKLDEDWYSPGDVISPGNPNILCRIQHEAYREGNGWVYTLRLVNDKSEKFVPAEYFKPNTPWSKLYSSYGEADIQDGSTIFSTPLILRTTLGKIRKKYAITDYSMNMVLAVKLRDQQGNTYDNWMRYAEAQYWQQWEREKETALWYSRYADSIKSATAYNVSTFPGVHEQIEGGLTYTYSTFNAQMIEEFMMDCFFGRVKPGEGRKIKAYTGEYGMRAFHKAMAKELGQPFGGSFTVIGNNFSQVEKVSSEFHSNAYSLGYQFVQYRMPNGGILELVHNPIYDDPYINSQRDPITGVPYESMRFTFLDFEDANGGNNIELLERKDGFKYGYVNGLVGPTGPANGGNISHSGEFYSMHASKIFGVKVIDPTRCGQLIFARN